MNQYIHLFTNGILEMTKIVYTFDDEARAVYKEFADKIVDLMNEKWEKPEQYGSIGNASKDRRTMIRYISLSLIFSLS